MYCPCPAAAAKSITATAQPQTALQTWGRYVDGSSNADASYKSSGYPSSPSSDWLALNFVKTADTTTATYNTYKDCYLKVLSANDAAAAPAASASAAEKKAYDFKQTMAKFAKGGAFTVLEEVEKNFKCAGFCQTPLFYATQAVSERPTQECITPLTTELGSAGRVAGVVALLSFLVAACGCCGSFPLCSKPEGNDDDA